MRTLAITQNITVDGSVEMLTDWFDPQGQGAVDMSDLMEESHRQDSRADALLVGRRTFEDFRGYWPQQTDDTTGITDYLNRVQKYVVSASLTDPRWEHTTVLKGDPVEEVTALKAREGGKDIVLTGSITLAHTMIAAGLVDEYRFFVYPVVQGRGRRLFPEGYGIPRLRLLESRAFRSGITLQRYAPAPEG
ncbi:dihydrofolate reductase family protein [Streptomyces sp. NBC_01020]|uniref:dihydrofolate reductase family protein n=1 Tax=unclassified Streptomyces TaxID=2593676 RepID=UPI00225B138A|nr:MULTISPECIES: dihydrofolate reductase family protein [unclassified Streptomyces]MCX4725519.1 dihydrofolate reductase family protein [Streptomyces sp. NBC_01306]WSV05116.1 dihydrofolate reductase family protein [Streptomyces sp. NBC_01020]WSX68810.1 dihydrofolate reductase family protein [Streptomyces sp. NBC_00932]